MMTVGLEPESIPVDSPDERRVILVVPTKEMERIKYSKDEKESSLSRVGGVCLVRDSIEFYEPESQKFLKQLKQQGLLNAENTLIQNAYNPSVYFKPDKIKDDVLKKKWQDYITVCNFLGAKEFSIEIQNKRRITSESRTVWNILSTFFNFNGSSKSFSEEVQEELLSFKGRLVGNLPNIEAANNYVNKESLQDDNDLKFLIQNRKTALKDGDVKHPTGLTQFEQTINLFSQIDKNLDIVTNLVIPEFLTQLKAQINNQVKKIETFSLTVKLKFPEKVSDG
ncbi:MAG: hypothetical protein F6J89_22485 [Symploca sp. SIO1C4]|uniref:Uncharacterized protein n=1 Tax=Symploca sp. SIO1C4 TaxID=2607765 RepID=A0A6B3NJK9_9CYAN|nr:hypothetical protein [Symploca sp. SIO1C4]